MHCNETIKEYTNYTIERIIILRNHMLSTTLCDFRHVMTNTEIFHLFFLLHNQFSIEIPRILT